MHRFLTFIFLFFIASFVFKAQAIYDPRSTPNNQFGIHVVDPTDIHGVQELVNSSGGEWGYVKVVIPDTDRNTQKWDPIFREFGRRKLIPIVRLATHVEAEFWVIPDENSLKDWGGFLNSLTWPTENRYVVLFNEPNHAKEWGGSIDPAGFAKKSVELAKQLKAVNEDFFILPAGLDTSAPSNYLSMSADTFLRNIKETVPEYFDVLDGWTSHSYPNPAFSGSPYASGRESIRSYLWEKQLLYSLGIFKNYPILIGETGWAHNEGLAKNNNNLSPETIGKYIKYVGESIWQDPNIFAITPFIYNYEAKPFDIFSWKKLGGGFHSHYYAYQEIPKTSGKPKIHEKYLVAKNTIPETLVTDSEYTLTLKIQNLGQAIAASSSGYSMELESSNPKYEFTSLDFPILEPDEEKEFSFIVKTPIDEDLSELNIYLTHNKQRFLLLQTNIKTIPPPKLEILTKLGFKKTSVNQFVKVIIYDGNKVLQEFASLPMVDGRINTPGLHSIVPGTTYRIVTIIPYYLPRQTIQIINDTNTLVEPRRFYPWDANNDQDLSGSDILSIIRHLKSFVERLF